MAKGKVGVRGANETVRAGRAAMAGAVRANQAAAARMGANEKIVASLERMGIGALELGRNGVYRGAFASDLAEFEVEYDPDANEWGVTGTVANEGMGGEAEPYQDTGTGLATLARLLRGLR